VELWHNPANYQSGGAAYTLEFTAAPTATSVQFQYQVSTAVGPFTVSDASLERQQLAYNISRKTYFLGSQAIATRISGDPDEDNGLFYIHTDHLGSTSLMSDSGGALVVDSVARYLPYGRWRTEPTADLTDRAYTGQKHNMDIGLYYYNARYYAPGIGRFISADTIVPDPTNPQQFNRYTYVLNNPIVLVDPTGHFSEAAIFEYLYNMYGDDWYSVYQAWQADTEWWELITTASAGDTIFTSANTHGIYYHFIGEGQDLLTGVYTNWAPNATLGNASLLDIQAGNHGIVWGGWFTNNSSGQVINVHHRMSVTSRFVYQPTGGSGIVGDFGSNLAREVLQMGVCSLVGGGIVCAAGVNTAVGPVWSLVNPLSYSVMGPNGEFMISNRNLSPDDQIWVSAGHVFSYHAAYDFLENRLMRTDITYYGHQPRIHPMWRLRVHYVYQ
jgi:RHS repeat-associated protein